MHQRLLHRSGPCAAHDAATRPCALAACRRPRCNHGCHIDTPRLHQGLQGARQLHTSRSSSSSRLGSVVPAAGRRRRSSGGATSSSGPGDEEQDLDIDDVMFETDGEAGEADELVAEVEEEDDLAVVDDEDEWEFGDEDEEEELEDDAAGEGAELSGWDAALANFDPAQDAAQAADEAAAAPTQEEQQQAAALKLVRSDLLPEGSELEVVELPDEAPKRDKTFDEQTVELSPADKAALAANRQAYAVFPMDRLELLVSEAPDGKLCLTDCFIRDTDEDLFSRPTVEEAVPGQQRMYQLLPWEHTNTGDGLKRINRKVTLMRMYFVGLGTADGPEEVDMSAVFSFDAASRTMQQHEVITLGEAMTEPVLRIREDGVYVEDALNVPGIVSVAEGFAGHPEDFYLYPDRPFDMREFVRMGLWPDPELPVGGAVAGGEAGGPGGGGGADELDAGLLEERLEELELMEELDDMPDVPAVDMV